MVRGRTQDCRGGRGGGELALGLVVQCVLADLVGTAGGPEA